MQLLDMKMDAQRHGYYVVENIQSSADGALVRVSVRSHTWRPPTDVYETDDAIIVRVEIAGMKEEEFSIVLDGRFLTVRGIRTDTTERRAYNQMEIPFGEFSVEVELSCPVAAREIEAVYSQGFLLVNMPKARPHRIQVEA